MKHRKPTPAWTEFRRVPAGPDYVPEPGETIWENSRYMVFMRPFVHPGLGRMVHLSIKRLDRKPLHDWRDLQRIKNEMIGADREAVEIYPKEARLVDTCNQYHLWCFLDAEIPFGSGERVVMETPPAAKAVQRPFPEDNKPPEVASGVEAG